MKWKVFILLLSFIGFAISQTITGEANSLEFLKDKLIYKGNVILHRDDAILKADEVVILLDKENKPFKLIAKGRVRFREKGRKAEAQFAEYDLKKETIYLKGNARIEEEGRIIEADEIIIYKKERRLVAKGKGKRVRTVYVEEKK